MSLPRDMCSNISTFTRGNKYTARSLALEVEDLVNQIEDMELNPIDFIWEAIDKDRQVRARKRELERSPVGKLWNAIKDGPWKMTAYRDNYGLIEGMVIMTPVDIKSLNLPYTIEARPHDSEIYNIVSEDPDEYEGLLSGLSELSGVETHRVRGDNEYHARDVIGEEWI